MPTPAPGCEQRPHILLVDDNHYGLAARKAVLQQSGYWVDTATCGEEALQLVHAAKFDLIVTDYRMPNMDGSELIRQVREAHPSIRAILLTGFVDMLGLTEENTGADIVIQKSAGEVAHLVRSAHRLAPVRVSRRPVQSQGSLLHRSHRTG
ncbi:MAG: response regulator [Bryobacteraceae bacterium]